MPIRFLRKQLTTISHKVFLQKSFIIEVWEDLKYAFVAHNPINFVMVFMIFKQLRLHDEQVAIYI